MLTFCAPSYLEDFNRAALDPRQRDIALQNLINDLYEAATEPDSFSINFLYPEDHQSHSMRVLRREQFFDDCFSRAANCKNAILRAMLFESILIYTGNPDVPLHDEMQPIHRAAAKFLLEEAQQNKDPRFAERMAVFQQQAVSAICGADADILTKMECGHLSPQALMIVGRSMTDCTLAEGAIFEREYGAADFAPCKN